MEKKIKKRYRSVQIGVLVIILAAIRLFEDMLFYDPLILFFRSSYLTGELPEMNMGLLLINLVMRFLLNTGISLLIILLAFRDIQILKFAAILYGILFLAGIPSFIFLLSNYEHEHYLALFYVRRFLIHPIFIIILLPAFYYYKLRSYE